MGSLGTFSTVVVIAAIITGIYLLYIRRSFGKTASTALALLVFVLLLLLLGGETCGSTG